MTPVFGLGKSRDGRNGEGATDPDPSAPAQGQNGIFGFWRRLFGSYRPEKRYMRGSDSLSVSERALPD